jgi:hypothetical protein
MRERRMELKIDDDPGFASLEAGKSSALRHVQIRVERMSCLMEMCKTVRGSLESVSDLTL